MIINSENLNTLSDTANLGLVISLLGYSRKSYEINKESLNINKNILEKDNSDKIYEILNEILKELKDINNQMKGVE